MLAFVSTPFKNEDKALATSEAEVVSLFMEDVVEVDVFRRLFRRMDISDDNVVGIFTDESSQALPLSTAMSRIEKLIRCTCSS
jgi:hypothetical protein